MPLQPARSKGWSPFSGFRSPPLCYTAGLQEGAHREAKVELMKEAPDRQKRLATMPVVALLAEHNARQGFFERGEFEALSAHLHPYVQDYWRSEYMMGWQKGKVA